ncbi:tRNA 2-thiouridine(34) synthase MnmA [Inmirania thermothiophila]|uniref:tRNA-specific 2-thiouridylase MnmA n=1 Tax=Inmirania thermothiophila TaxID=1750597 RepID=A0A3N1Y270_9GAMM|nr:tRNA 2-thiouridine(34) synthase MnmA [Inmirania thermothiophila]ROR32621.1 tRNA (5-methylaminomethyl-2-thiouridylate)-methyltransferase [Inmirania thermothiophila]
MRVVVGLSGGVDSAVAALLALRAGHEVHAVFMRNWVEEDGSCSAGDDLVAAAAVADRLGIDLDVVDLSREYRAQVFAPFLAGYAAGRTPNPDVLCNREIKFGRFLAHARRLGAERVVTGHYARIGPGPSLLRGLDGDKDQSYFLHLLTREQLAAALFPLGGMYKAAVRRLAREAGLPNHDRPDSTGICFIGERDFAGFLGRYLAPRPGPMVTPEGTVVGEHRGLHFYTIGQRQRLGIGGRRGAGGAPWYVAAKRPQDNALVVVQGADHPLLLASALSTGPAHWIAGEPPRLPARLAVQIRHRAPAVPARVREADGGRLEIAFERPVRAAAPGQAAVLYAGETCLGGAEIEAVQTVAAARRAAGA